MEILTLEITEIKLRNTDFEWSSLVERECGSHCGPHPPFRGVGKRKSDQTAECYWMGETVGERTEERSSQSEPGVLQVTVLLVVNFVQELDAEEVIWLVEDLQEAAAYR